MIPSHFQIFLLLLVFFGAYCIVNANNGCEKLGNKFGNWAPNAVCKIGLKGNAVKDFDGSDDYVYVNRENRQDSMCLKYIHEQMVDFNETEKPQHVCGIPEKERERRTKKKNTILV